MISSREISLLAKSAGFNSQTSSFYPMLPPSATFTDTRISSMVKLNFNRYSKFSEPTKEIVGIGANYDIACSAPTIYQLIAFLRTKDLPFYVRKISVNNHAYFLDGLRKDTVDGFDSYEAAELAAISMLLKSII